MKKLLFPALLALVSMQTNAQEIYALTGQPGTAITFKDLRSLDVSGATSSNVIFSAEAKSSVYSQNLQQNISETKTSLHNAQTPSIAALAYDQKCSSLFYVPMFSSNIYVLNTRTNQITLVENTAIKSEACTLGSHITRMTATKDGSIYAMSNSGSQLLKIKNEKGRYTVQDLGTIKDAVPNAEQSLSKMQTGFGGDMIADAEQNLYVLSAFKNVYKISLKNLSSQYLGTISGLPDQYTINGSAVNSSGNIIIGNAQGQALYEVDFKTLQAKPLEKVSSFPIYDLASPYFVNDEASPGPAELFTGISVYPTKVNQQFFNIKINNEKIKGNLKVELQDLMGNKVVTQTISVLRDRSEFRVALKKMNAGVYILNINDATGQTIFNTKLLVE